MVNAQEWLDKWYPKEGKCIFEKDEKNFGAKRPMIFNLRIIYQNLEGSLDLSGFVNLEKLNFFKNQLTSLDLSQCGNLKILVCSKNQFTSVDFLNTLPHPEKLEELEIWCNNIQPTDIAVFSRFTNLRELKIGYNKFFGSFQSWQNLTKLRNICIEATDVNEGLEYLPMSLAQATQGGKYSEIECSSHDTNAKCLAIQNELRPFNYDLEAWQLAHPEKMLIARPEYFINEDSKDKWIEALKNKIKQGQEVLDYIVQNEPNKEVKIIRLETQIKIIKILEEVKKQLREEIEEERETHEDAMKAMDNFYQQNPPREDLRLKSILQQFEEEYLKLNRENKQKEQKIKELEGTIKVINKLTEPETQDQGTQTELTGEELKKQQKEIKELREQINKLTVKK